MQNSRQIPLVRTTRNARPAHENRYVIPAPNRAVIFQFSPQYHRNYRRFLRRKRLISRLFTLFHVNKKFLPTQSVAILFAIRRFDFGHSLSMSIPLPLSRASSQHFRFRVPPIAGLNLDFIQ